MTRSCCWLLSAALVIASATPALAVEPAELEQARATFTQGEEHFTANRFAEARDAFGAVLKVVEVPAVAYMAGQAHEKLGELVKAARLYGLASELQQNRFWADQAKQRQAQKDARAALKALNGRIPTLQIEVKGDRATVAELTLDGTKIAVGASATPQQLDPGDHTFVLSTQDGRTLKQTVTLAEREQKSLTLDLANAVAPPPAKPSGESTSPAVAAPPAPLPVVTPPSGHITTNQPTAKDSQAGKTQRTIAYVSLGVGAAGLALGATAGIVTWEKYADLKSKCDDNRGCEGPIYDSDNPGYDTWRHVSTAGFIVAGVGAALGVTLLLVKPSKEAPPQVSLMLGPGALRVGGEF